MPQRPAISPWLSGPALIVISSVDYYAPETGHLPVAVGLSKLQLIHDLYLRQNGSFMDHGPTRSKPIGDVKEKKNHWYFVFLLTRGTRLHESITAGATIKTLEFTFSAPANDIKLLGPDVEAGFGLPLAHSPQDLQRVPVSSVSLCLPSIRSNWKPRSRSICWTSRLIGSSELVSAEDGEEEVEEEEVEEETDSIPL
ncbi:hypothetical protein RRG08_056653 [Elysia crispata]|uniref:Uncharacterized protein n=1 Tax=Elysia crispata TaxID=231223 RepID=A0AAE0YFY6_9GAST|nr:hypothetical protein RRG08_056653 [Elysia crispata]